MDPMANRVKVWKYFQGQTIETNNFAFKAKVILDMKSLAQMARAKIGLNGSHDQ